MVSESYIAFALVVAIAAIAARPVVFQANRLVLSYQLSFAVGAYAMAGFLGMGGGGTPGEASIAGFLLAGLLASAVLGCLSMAPVSGVVWHGMRSEGIGLFSFSYSLGLWMLAVASGALGTRPEGIIVGRQVLNPVLLFGGIALIVLVSGTIVWRFERGWIGRSLDFMALGVADQRMYGLDAAKIVAVLVLTGGGLAGLAGAGATLVFGQSQKEWGEPTLLIYIFIATMLSTRKYVWTVVPVTAFVLLLRPVIAAIAPPRYAALETAVFGIVLIGIAIGKAVDRRGATSIHA